MQSIHPTALVHPSLKLPLDLVVGPYAILEEGVRLGDRVRIGPFAHLYSGVQLGDDVNLFEGVVLGSQPQDLKYRGEETAVVIGPRTILREYVTVNRGTAASGSTCIGQDSLIMAYSHVAHDCRIGDFVILANGVQMGGHVSIGSHSVLSGMTGIHQFVTIGPGVFVGGCLRVDKDIPPYSKAMGDPLSWAGVNEIGLRKRGYGSVERGIIKNFYRQLFQNGYEKEIQARGTGNHLEIPQENIHALPLQEEWNTFFRNRKRGLLGRRSKPT